MGANRRFTSLASAGLAALCALSLSGGAAAMPEIQHWSASNGARVYFAPTPELPMVDIQAVFDAGSARDGDAGGLAAFANALLKSGAGGWDEERIAAAFDELGAQLTVGARRDMATLSLRSLSDAERLRPALEWMAQILAHPRFPAAALERERARRLVALQIEAQRPGAVAEKAFYRALYGDHPYGQPPGGTEASVKALTREQIIAFHQRHYVGANAVVAIVGDLTRQQAEEAAETLMRPLPAGGPAPPLPPTPPPQAQTTHIARPSQQTHILIGQPTLRRDDPDYYALYLGNHALGGGMTSRIYDEIREKRGLAYSAYSAFYPMRLAGPWRIGLQTRNEKGFEALAQARATVRQFVADGPSDEELERARKNITGSHPLRIDSNGKIANYLAMIGFYRLPLNYLQSFNARIDAVDRAQVQEALRRRIDLDSLTTITVGAPAAAPEKKAAPRQSAPPSTP